MTTETMVIVKNSHETLGAWDILSMALPHCSWQSVFSVKPLHTKVPPFYKAVPETPITSCTTTTVLSPLIDMLSGYVRFRCAWSGLFISSAVNFTKYRNQLLVWGYCILPFNLPEGFESKLRKTSGSGTGTIN